jgi:GTPase
MVIITKIDICPPHILEETITQLTKILKSPGAKKIPIFIKGREDCINTAVCLWLRVPLLHTNLAIDSVCQSANLPDLPGVQCHWREH